MKSHIIAGGGGVPLHVVETGAPAGRSILFIHGFSQCCLAWSRQLHSELAADRHLIAMDLRGHGLSGKPRDAYADSQLWADDVNAVIQALDLDRPILSGWSYGPLVILDYLRHYGEERIGGVQIVGGITRLGTEQATSVLAPEFLSLVPDFFSNDIEAGVRGMESLLRLCFAREVSSADKYSMLGSSVSTPPHVRQALFSRSFDNDDLLPKLRKPVLITHGTEDAIVSPTVVDEHKAGIAHAEIQMMYGAGHAAFWDDAPAFNRRLREFSANQ
jgi:pimeloyl-ACP methyl ester carboxylesterase